jgi:hypothetical protein
LANRKRQAFKDIWPIIEAAGRAPDGWPGWPEGKRFAFVLTHDVEGPEGLAKCRRLMQIDMELGFRSSFGFIPEGEYAVPRQLREELVRNGFKVVVHDLYHDGKLYATREGFSDRAKRINHYLKEWGARGFRAGFIFHNLDWLHELDIEYDSSTFDTDPFEPQSDGVYMIFPFWVRRPVEQNSTPRQGYVEIPCTLPQDSTLFLVLGEKTTDIWTRKLDGIAEHGGMALVNVHPDYLCFNGEKLSSRTFPVALYAELSHYIRTRYSAEFWHALAREVASHMRRSEVCEASCW